MVVPRSFLPNSRYTGPASTVARNMLRASNHVPFTWGEPSRMKTGRGAHRAISSCEATGRLPGVSGPSYSVSPKLRRQSLAPPSPEEPTKAVAKRGAYAIVTNIALPYRRSPPMPTCLASTACQAEFRSAIAVRRRAAVCGEQTSSCPPTKRETVVVDTPARAATSLIVDFRYGSGDAPTR